MKRTRIVMAALLLLLPLLCRAQKGLFEKFCDMKDVTSVYISKAMIDSNAYLHASDVFIGKVKGQLNSVQTMSSMHEEVIKQMRKEYQSLLQSSKYELLMKQKNTTKNTTFYMRKNGDVVKELIMIEDGKAKFKVVYLEGDMTLKDIQQIMMFQS